jgi:hypothetical protein
VPGVSPTVLEVATPAVAAEVLQDEVVALNVETGVYFSLRGLAATLWNDLAAGHPAERLAALGEAEGVGAAPVESFVAQILGHRLMRPAGRPAASGEPTSLTEMRGVRPEIVFEIYEDMQDLILSDPIHDVDPAVGWPPRKPELA